MLTTPTTAESPPQISVNVYFTDYTLHTTLVDATTTTTTTTPPACNHIPFPIPRNPSSPQQPKIFGINATMTGSSGIPDSWSFDGFEFMLYTGDYALGCSDDGYGYGFGDEDEDEDGGGVYNLTLPYIAPTYDTADFRIADGGGGDDGVVDQPVYYDGYDGDDITHTEQSVYKILDHNGEVKYVHDVPIRQYYPPRMIRNIEDDYPELLNPPFSPPRNSPVAAEGLEYPASRSREGGVEEVKRESEDEEEEKLDIPLRRIPPASAAGLNSRPDRTPSIPWYHNPALDLDLTDPENADLYRPPRLSRARPRLMTPKRQRNQEEEEKEEEEGEEEEKEESPQIFDTLPLQRNLLAEMNAAAGQDLAGYDLEDNLTDDSGLADPESPINMEGNFIVPFDDDDDGDDEQPNPPAADTGSRLQKRVIEDPTTSPPPNRNNNNNNNHNSLAHQMALQDLIRLKIAYPNSQPPYLLINRPAAFTIRAKFSKPDDYNNIINNNYNYGSPSNGGIGGGGGPEAYNPDTEDTSLLIPDDLLELLAVSGQNF
ncbi:hypothetical protein TWF730_003217 [Orbilia blumenaviensis]|uniref:Uncharacterized protein n=1 Tax=Orbilia blumenaviensis TaxID=1796055 RepID=A0AAV9U4Q0_9PEZI